MSNQGEWRQASKREPCPVCEKTGWCSITGAEGAIEAVVCMRVESNNPRANGGHLHKLRESTNWSAPPMDSKHRIFATAHEALAALEKKLGPRSRIWKYFDAAGEPVGVVSRWDRDGDKEIRPVSRVANGWAIAAMAEPRPLYDLPAVIKSPAVFINEGEKAADAVRSMGMAATTSSGGSAAVAKTDWKPLAGKVVVIWPDNDAPGEKYAAAVIAELAKFTPAPKVSIIRPSGMPEKGDAADWLAAGGTFEQLEKLVLESEPVTLAPPAQRTIADGPRQTTLYAAAKKYIERIGQGETGLISIGIGEVDYAIGGGVEQGEMIIFAARPSHGKSAVALQCAHCWTEQRIPTLIISEEMSALALGKRTLQWASSIPQDQWTERAEELKRDLDGYSDSRATCIISEPCVRIEAVVETIERAVDEFGIRAVCIDYAQLLQGQGKTRYEQVSFVSNRLRETASRLNVLMLTLCQLNREVEKRQRFIPCSADIRDSGSLEQDADVIALLAWPHKVDAKQPPNLFQFFISKNRNRAIHQQIVHCRFDPSRQMITESTAREQSNYHPEFDEEPSHDPFN